MQQRRGRYFQMRRWERHDSGQVAADSTFARACGASGDSRFPRMMQDYIEDRLQAAVRTRLEAAPDPRGDSAWD